MSHTVYTLVQLLFFYVYKWSIYKFLIAYVWSTWANEQIFDGIWSQQYKFIRYLIRLYIFLIEFDRVLHECMSTYQNLHVSQLGDTVALLNCEYKSNFNYDDHLPVMSLIVRCHFGLDGVFCTYEVRFNNYKTKGRK